MALELLFSECPRPRRAVERTPGDKLELADLKSEVGRSFHPLAARCYRFTDPATGGRVVFSGDTFYHQGCLFSPKTVVYWCTRPLHRPTRRSQI